MTEDPLADYRQPWNPQAAVDAGFGEVDDEVVTVTYLVAATGWCAPSGTKWESGDDPQ